jgi:hypothetical protein
LEYDWGGFDLWCTFIRNPDGTRSPPRDIEYFSDIAELGEIFGPQRLYSDIKKIFVLTGKEVDAKILEYISLISEEYGEKKVKIEILFTILYAAFIAEENKTNTKLGKRIKLLGIYQVLIEGIVPSTAASFSRGMMWQDISKQCEIRGF